MKTKRTLLSIITLCAALSLTACNGSGASTTENSQKVRTESTTEAVDNSNTKLDDLYQQENQILQITRMYGTRHLAWRIKAMLIQAEIMPIIWPA